MQDRIQKLLINKVKHLDFIDFVQLNMQDVTLLLQDLCKIKEPSSININEYLKLTDTLNWASYFYYSLDTPILDDSTYDLLYNFLKKIEENNETLIQPIPYKQDELLYSKIKKQIKNLSNYLSEGSTKKKVSSLEKNLKSTLLDLKKYYTLSPTQQVGGSIKNLFNPVQHNPPMLSLENANDLLNFLKFHERVTKKLYSSISIKGQLQIQPSFIIPSNQTSKNTTFNQHSEIQQTLFNTHKRDTTNPLTNTSNNCDYISLQLHSIQYNSSSLDNITLNFHGVLHYYLSPKNTKPQLYYQPVTCSLPLQTSLFISDCLHRLEAKLIDNLNLLLTGTLNCSTPTCSKKNITLKGQLKSSSIIKLNTSLIVNLDTNITYPSHDYPSTPFSISPSTINGHLSFHHHKADAQIQYHCETKFDGLAIELIYRQGIFTQASTRGDGTIGEDITANMINVKNIPRTLKTPYPPEYISIRGECVMKTQDFLTLNEQLIQSDKKQFANPRNTVSGTLRQKKNNMEQERIIHFFPYSYGSLIESDASLQHNPCTDLQSVFWNNYLITLGFTTEKQYSQTSYAFKVKLFYNYILENRSQLPYDIDGIVIKVNNIKYHTLLGTTSKHPLSAIAFKFPSMTGITSLLKVTYQIGRTGIITPVAELAPINIGGVIVKRASLHNISEMTERLKLHINDHVKVKRGGDVIPKVTQALIKYRQANTKPIKFIEHCPVCEYPLQQEKIFIRCTNTQCKGIIKEKFKYFVSKEGFNIEGLGKEWVTTLYQKGLIHDFADIFNLVENDLLPLEKMADISASNIIDSIQKSKNTTLYIVLRALGIPQIGKYMAKILAQHFKTIESVMQATQEDLLKIHEIGETTAQAIYSFFQDNSNKNLIHKFLQFDVKIASNNLKHSQTLKDKVFVFTGTFQTLQRSEAEQLVQTLGAKATSTVSKKTSYVVVGETPGSKLQKAQELNITLMEELEFLAFIQKSKQGQSSSKL